MNFWTVLRSVVILSVLSIPAACDRGGEAESEPAEPAASAASAAEPTFTAVTDRLLTAATAARESWLVHGGSYNNQRYSTLDQINRENVAGLVPAWVYQTGVPESFETTPIVAGNTMYISTPESHVIALNAATGRELWRYTPALETAVVCCGPNNRGVAAYRDKVYVGLLDARIVALDHRTGEVAWESNLADSEDGYSITMAPLAYDGKVVTGVAGGEYGIRGFVTALDAETGEEVWRFHTIPAPDEAPNGWWGEWKETTPFGMPLHRDVLQEKEDSLDNARAWRQGGGGVWTTPAYDPNTGSLFLVVGNPAPSLAGSVRPGDNLYTGSIVALDGETGEIRWHFQYLPHDQWNLSGGSPPFLFENDGRTYVGHAGKTGWLYIVDAESGKPVLRSQNFVPQENLFRPPTHEGVRMLPGTNGGNSGSPVAYSPRHDMAYVLGLHQPMVYTRQFTSHQDGFPWLGGSFTYLPDEQQWGTLSAIDLTSGEIAWQRRVPVPMIGSALATAGDVVFTGQGSGTFDAFDAESGELLWQFRTGAGVHGGPVTYMIDGVQYVAVAAGGNYQLDTPRGDNLYVFALYDHRPDTSVGTYEPVRYDRGRARRFGAVRQVPASQVQPESPDTSDRSDNSRPRP